jgi:hypothetical protein
VWFVIADYFAVSDLSVFWDVFQFYEEKCVSSWNVLNAQEQASAFIAKTSGPKWLETGILHESRVFHLFSRDWVDDCVGTVPLRTMVIFLGKSPYGLCLFRKSHLETGFAARVAGIHWTPLEVNDVVS